MRCARQSTCGNPVKETGRRSAVDGNATIRIQRCLTPTAIRSFARLSRRAWLNMMIVTKFLRSCCHPVTVDEIHRRTPVAEARSDRVLLHALQTAPESGGLREATAGSYLRAWSGRVRPGTRAPSYVPNFTAYGGTCLNTRGISRVGPTIRIRRQPFQYRWTEWSHRQSSSAPVQ